MIYSIRHNSILASPSVADGCTDDTEALEHFTRVFHTRYGSTSLILYIGSLDRAIQESLYSSIDNVSRVLVHPVQYTVVPLP